MAFWDGLVKGVRNFFGGNRRKKDEEQRQNQQPRRVASSPTPRFNSNQQQSNNWDESLKVRKPKNVFEDQTFGDILKLPGSRPTQKPNQGVPPLLARPPEPVVKTKEQQLEELTNQNLDKARKEVEQGQDWFDKGINFFTKDNERLARQGARTKAVKQFQDKHGRNKDPEVMKFAGNTRDMINKHSQSLRIQNYIYKKIGSGFFDKNAQGIQYVPVAGSVFNVGLAGNEKLAKARGSDLFGNSAEATREMRNKVDFGMTNAEFDALPEETRKKLHNVQNIGLALSPLDFTGLGGLTKSTGVATGKKAALKLFKEGAVDAATKQALKTTLKGSIKTALPTAIVGTGASAGIQQYLTGEVDPLAALKTGLMTGGTSMLIPNAPNTRVQVPGAIDEAVDAVTPRKIDVKQPRSITVGDATPESMGVPVRRIQPETRPIIDVAGDTPGVNRVSVPTAAERFANQPTGRPDRAVEGILPGRAEMPKAETPTPQAPKVEAPDPTAALKAEALKYKSADEFADSLNAMKYGKVTGVGQLPIEKINKTQIKALIERGLPHTDTNLKVSDFKPGRQVTQPLEVYSKGGSWVVENGNHRLAQALANGGKTIPVVFKGGEGKKYSTPITDLYNQAHTEAKISANSPEISQLRQKVESAKAPAPQKTQIQVKQVRSIPVDDMSSMPDPVVTPVKANTTSKSAPNEVSVPVTKNESDADLPADVQEILANPRKFSKRQVEAARNQRKLARQMAKTKEQTAEAIGRIDAVSPNAVTDKGFVPTGEFGKSVNGGAYQKVNRATEMQAAVNETANLAPSEVIRQATETASQNGGGYNRRDIRNVAALFETKRIQRGTPEWDAARQILKEDGTNWGQAGALRNYTMRKNASADELISRFESKIYRMVDDPSKIDSKLFDQVDAAETAFVEARDASKQAFNRFTESPTSANAKAFHAAQDAADKAEMQAKQVEFTVAQKATKGNKDIQQVRELEKMAQEADMYQMDAVDASMLSGTGTFVRNFVNASVGSVEEGLLGKVSSRIASKITGQDVGGGGFVKGFKKGAGNVVDASKARASAAGKNPFEHLKNWATTGNQLGDSMIDAQTSRNVGDHYTQVLRDQGYKGSELKNRASVMARMDPDNVSETYQAAARTAAGLGSGVTRNNKIETTVKNIISDAISGGNPNAVSENTAKLVTRMTLGFPTAIGRSVAEGAKRFTLGAPTFIKAMRTADPQQKAILIKEGIKQAGSGGLIIPSMFYGLGASGAITGSYPEDQAERDRWQREGITENSIKIGDDYYQLPAYLGSWAVPSLFYASLGRNNGDFAAAASDTAKIVPSLLPTDQLTNVTDVINGRSDFGKFMSQTGASAVRAATPAGALLNQFGKMLDPTQNETNDGNAWENMVSKIINGIPVANLALGDKTDSDGNTLRNPDPLALAFGAASTEQKAGIERSAELDANTNNTLETMASYGAFADPNLKSVIDDPKVKKIYSDIVNGKQVNPSDLEKVQKAMVKGVSEKGTDTAYLEREQYDSHLTALRVKRDLMAADPTQKPSDLEKMDVAIKRGELYRDNQIPYDLIKAYQDTSLTEWKSLADEDPELHEQLWVIDELMAQNSVSYAKGKLDKQKYASKSGSGRGRGGGRGGRGGSGGAKMGTDFGTLKAGVGAPDVQAYDTIEQQGGNVPVIQVKRPNIVHKIGFSG